jgi:hypothetical protein
MKNNLLKYYIAAFYLCSTFAAFAAETPGDNTSDGSLESTDAAAAPLPIDNYVWVLALVGLFLVFMKFRAIQKNKIQG